MADDRGPRDNDDRPRSGYNQRPGGPGGRPGGGRPGGGRPGGPGPQGGRGYGGPQGGRAYDRPQGGSSYGRPQGGSSYGRPPGGQSGPGGPGGQRPGTGFRGQDRYDDRPRGYQGGPGGQGGDRAPRPGPRPWDNEDRGASRPGPRPEGPRPGGDRYDRPRHDDRPRYDDRPRQDDRPRYDAPRPQYDDRPRGGPGPRPGGYRPGPRPDQRPQQGYGQRPQQGYGQRPPQGGYAPRPDERPPAPRQGGPRPWEDAPRDDEPVRGSRAFFDAGWEPAAPPDVPAPTEHRAPEAPFEGTPPQAAHEDAPAPVDRPEPHDRPQGDRPPFDRPQYDRGPRPGYGRPPAAGAGFAAGRYGRPGGDRGFVRRPPAPSLEAIQLAEGEELVAGRRPVEEAFVARREARRLYVVPQRRMALEKLVLHATSLRIPVVEVEGGSMTAIAGFDGHQGIALVVAPRRWAAPDDILALAKQRGQAPLVLVLDSLEDPQNVGTLLRTAEAQGVHGALFPTHHQAPLSPAAVKASAGAVEHLQLAPVDDLAGALADLHVRGLRIVGADGDAQLTAREADLRGPVAIVVGSEGKGLSAAVRRRCDLLVRIPMHGKIDSLNASVAGSILLYEAAAQRGLQEEHPASASEILGTTEDAEPEGAVEASAPAPAEPVAAETSVEADAEPIEPEPAEPVPAESEPVAAPPAKPKRTRKASPAVAVAAPAPDPGPIDPDEALLPGGPLPDAAADEVAAPVETAGEEPAEPPAEAPGEV